MQARAWQFSLSQLLRLVTAAAIAAWLLRIGYSVGNLLGPAVILAAAFFPRGSKDPDTAATMIACGWLWAMFDLPGTLCFPLASFSHDPRFRELIPELMRLAASVFALPTLATVFVSGDLAFWREPPTSTNLRCVAVVVAGAASTLAFLMYFFAVISQM